MCAFRIDFLFKFVRVQHLRKNKRKKREKIAKKRKKVTKKKKREKENIKNLM